MRSVFAALLVLLASLSLAQTPSETIQSFVGALNRKDLDAVAALIKGGKVDSAMRKSLALGSPWPSFSIKNLTERIAGNAATVSYELTMTGRTRMPAPHRETASLAKVGNSWVIVAPQTIPRSDEVFPQFAYLMSHPDSAHSALTASKATLCLSNIKQIALGCMMFMADHNDALRFKGNAMKSSIMPYVRNKAIFTCPLDPTGTMSYSFNAKLDGVEESAVKYPAQTVMVYEGKNGKLSFRHEGRASVAFMDGHAKLISQAQAKSLIWKK